MSKVKVKKKNCTTISTTMPLSAKKHKKAKRKKYEGKAVKNAVEDVKIKSNALLPPKDSQQFSTNWKNLQEVLKLNTKVQEQEFKRQDGSSISNESKVEGKPIKDIPAKGTSAQLIKETKNGKQQTAKDGLLPASTKNDKLFVQSEQSNTRKRKSINGQTPIYNNRQQNKNKRFHQEAEKKLTEDDIWFDDVDPDDIEAAVGTGAADIVRSRQRSRRTDQKSIESSLVKCRAFDGLTKAVAMDCEMVGVGPEGQDSIVARVSMVNQFGKCVYDKYVKPTERVTDYRTHVSGIRPQDIKNGEDVKTVQKEVLEVLEGRILVGHAIHNDLKILLLDHPKKRIRDTQKYKPFKSIVKSGRPSLKLLCEKILNVKVQQGEHSSVQDAQATMRLYTLVKKQWELSIKEGYRNGAVDKCTDHCILGTPHKS
ncbi:RNA exonuclease 4 isoform X2 [Paramormyrops kingsleyae]|uniref:RNA exonuclease 4 isoform X2 n=1 Tax=Paramormyrops kingsleyae TaxID=1676925 RepID=UPI000CD60B0B|nr:RNA exonuclease 4 isoform X2 [Paramormyrops kingsleyae]